MLQPSCYCRHRWGNNTDDDDRRAVADNGKDNDQLVTMLTWLSSNFGLNDLSNDHHRFHRKTKNTILPKLPNEINASSTIATSGTLNSPRCRKTIHGSLECRTATGQRCRPRVKTKTRSKISSKYYSPRDRQNNNFVSFTFSKTVFICSNFTKILLIILALVMPISSSVNSYQNEFMMHDNKNSGQCK